MSAERNRPVGVAVLGAAGTIAPAIVHDLAESDEVDRLLLLDLDGAQAAAVASEHGGGKAAARSIDARAEGKLASALGDFDVLVNTASYRINLEAMRACLSAECHYLDLGGLYWMTGRQLELSSRFQDAGLLAVLGIGSSPGKTNLMAQRALKELGDDAGEIDSIEVAAAGRDPRAADDGRLRPPYAIQTLLDELTLAPIVLRDGRPTEIQALQPGGTIDFGDPIGPAETIYTLHSELAAFGESFHCATASFRLSLAGPLLAKLKALVGSPEENIAEAARQAQPASNETTSVHLVTVTAASGAKVVVRALTGPHFGLGGSIVSTAAPAAAAVRLLARGSLTARGALPPERCIDADEMFAELEARGCSFTVGRGGPA
jgi:saccharopine dehydrogenase (NAD+, L-lysine-forming)